MDDIGINSIGIYNIGIDNNGKRYYWHKKYWDGDKLRLIIILRIINICMFGKYYLSLVNIQD